MMRVWIVAISVGLAGAAGCSPSPPAAAQSPSAQALAADLTGVASVIDGDTLEIRGERVRLYGVDAFESGQRCRGADGGARRCGREAALMLDALVQGHTVFCRNKDRDRWGRRVAQCRTEAAGDLSAALVEGGWAIAFRRYSQTYVGLEERARAERRGAWAGSFDAPSDWRAGRRSQASS